MERHRIIDAMTGLKFYGARKGSVLRDELHSGFEYWPVPETTTRRSSTGMPEDVMPIKEGVCFLGARFDIESMEEAVCNILAATQEEFKYVVTPNVQHIVRLLDDPPTMRPLYDGAWRVYCDSRVLSALAWFSGQRLPVITGSDLTAHLMVRAAEQRLTIAIIGPTAADCAVLEDRYPGLNLEVHAPPMGFVKSEYEVQRCISFLARTQATLIFLAVGMPQQEILAHQIAAHPQIRGVGLCVGASIDFLTGKQRRAPVWIQKVGLEWFHRLMSNPRRLARRYLIECPWIFYFVFLEWSKNRAASQLRVRLDRARVHRG